MSASTSTTGATCGWSKCSAYAERVSASMRSPSTSVENRRKTVAARAAYGCPDIPRISSMVSWGNRSGT